MILDGAELHESASVILHVPSGRQIPRGGPCDRIDQDAFRCDEDGISVTWVEFYRGSRDEQIRQASLAMKGPLLIRRSGVIARAIVGDIREVMLSAGALVGVRRDRLDHNAAHCLIQGIPKDHGGHLLALTRAFRHLIPADTIPGLV